jgi:DUF4097 and DUF4098 domain-containing protein YvlB
MRFACALIAALLLSGCIIDDFDNSDRYQSDFHYTWDMQPDVRVNAESFNGLIEIAGWDQNKVEITGTKFASTEPLRDAIKIDIQHTPGSVDIRAVKPSGRIGGMGARFTMHVPRSAQLDRITTSNGGIRINDVAGAAHLLGSNGIIKVGNVSGNVDAHTSNGGIDVESIRGGATLKTSNGGIRAENVGGAFDAETSNGAIELTAMTAPKENIRARTSNGGITLHLPPATAARLIANTSNSSVSCEFDLTSRSENRKNHLEGMIGAGGPTIELNSSNGRIRVLRDNTH